VKGKVAIVTGAASGIGRATALLLAEQGAQVVCIDIDAAGLTETVREIHEARGIAVDCPGDVSRDPDCKRAVDAAEQLGGLDVVANIAGIMQTHGDSVETLSEEAWDRTLAVNVKSIFLMARHAIPALRRRGGGVIVNTASVHAFANMPESASYAASKGAVVALTRQMAHDCAPDQIRVVAVAPGSVDTPMSQRAVDSSGKSSLEELGFSSSQKVLGRVGKPEELAQVIAWLASEKASFVNGVTLPADGGLLARLI
jgi:NAD(P)-dependent dehydrogenase (short-subunit alcohol dehydrogenase family)